MRWLAVVVTAAGLLSGCEKLNDIAVRRWHEDRHYGSQMNEQISDGYRRRMEVPAPAGDAPRPLAPTGLDEG